MPKNPLGEVKPKEEKSPTDPQECCVWANARLHPDVVGKAEWVGTGDPKRPIRLRWFGE